LSREKRSPPMEWNPMRKGDHLFWKGKGGPIQRKKGNFMGKGVLPYHRGTKINFGKRPCQIDRNEGKGLIKFRAEVTIIGERFW